MHINLPLGGVWRIPPRPIPVFRVFGVQFCVTARPSRSISVLGAPLMRSVAA